ncbi:MAG: alpha/beta fold hydrolase [Actinomycetales bacterium]
MTEVAAPQTWVDDVGREELLELLARHGVDVNSLTVPDPVPGAGLDEPPESQQYQIVPMRDGWLRIGIEAMPQREGTLVGRWIRDPAHPAQDVLGEPIFFDETDADDLDGWVRARADFDGSGRRWIYVLRRPEREAYVALVYEAGPTGPVRRSLVTGVYPDITLCDEDGGRLAYVQPDRTQRGLTRAVLAPAFDDTEATTTVLRDSTHGGLGVKACSVRRFIKLSHGVRTRRVWDLVDVRSASPVPITVPGVSNDPALFDVALLDTEPVLAQAINRETVDGQGRASATHWELTVSRIVSGRILQRWSAATGVGLAREVTSDDGCALVRVFRDGFERLLRVPLDGFSSAGEHAPLQESTGMFSLVGNSVTPSIGLTATELCGGLDPFLWYWRPDGTVLNTDEEIIRRAACLTRKQIVRIAGDDDYEFDLDVRWPVEGGDHFRGPVLLMLYGAYGLDIDLDNDRDLGRWLGRGFAVATAHVRGGGAEARHLAGCRANRDRSVADAAAAVRWLRSPSGPVTASALCVLGASAGGFLAATTLNTCPDLVDACVIVNGYVDPLTSLIRQDTATPSSDRDEWGDPQNNPNDLETLQAVSPVDNLCGSPTARALVIVSANDVRVNPRQGLKWVLTYRGLGGQAALWFDPKGAHDCWGAGMDPDSLVGWVDDALQARPPTVEVAAAISGSADREPA